MPQIGWFEILIIVSIAIIVVGPKDFPVMLKKVGSWIGSAKRYFSDVQNQVTEITDVSINEELKKFCDSFYSIGIKTNTLIDDSKYFDKKTALQKEKYLQALNQRDIAVQEYKKMKKKLETIKKQVEHLKIPFTDEKTK